MADESFFVCHFIYGKLFFYVFSDVQTLIGKQGLYNKSSSDQWPYSVKSCCFGLFAFV